MAVIIMLIIIYLTLSSVLCLAMWTKDGDKVEPPTHVISRICALLLAPVICVIAGAIFVIVGLLGTLTLVITNNRGILDWLSSTIDRLSS